MSLAVVSLVLMAIMALVAVPVFARVTGEATRIPWLEDTDRGLPAKEPGSGAGAVDRGRRRCRTTGRCAG